MQINEKIFFIHLFVNYFNQELSLYNHLYPIISFENSICESYIFISKIKGIMLKNIFDLVLQE